MKKFLILSLSLVALASKSQTCTLTASKNPACIGDTVWLKASSNFTATNFVFGGPAIFSSTSVDSVFFIANQVSLSGIYTCTLSNSTNTCIANTSFSIDNILNTAIASSSSFCQNSNAGLSAYAFGASSYFWTGPAGFSSSLQNPLITNIQPSSAGIYTVLITSVNGCMATKFATLNVMPTPTVTIFSTNTVCINGIISLSASGGVTYQWTGPNGFISSSQNPTISANTMAFSGNYYLSVTDVNGCTNTGSTSVLVQSVPLLNIVSSFNTGCAPLCTSFSVSSSSPITSTTLNLGNGTTINNVTASTCYTASGIFTVTAKSIFSNGCPSAQSNYTIQVNPKPVADFGWTVLNNGWVNFIDASYNAAVNNWNWSFTGTSAFTSNLQNPTFHYTDTTINYNVCLIVKSNYGCADTICKTVFFNTSIGINELKTENELTIYPNPVNDNLVINGVHLPIEIEISDCLGNLILQLKTTKDLNNVKLTNLQPGVYFVRIYQENKKIANKKIIKE